MILPTSSRIRLLGAVAAIILALPAMAIAAKPAKGPQADLDRFAQTLGYRLTVESNKVTEGCPSVPVQQYCMRVALDLTLPKTLPSGDWAIYLGFVQPMLPLQDDRFDLTHINGDLYRLSPKPGVVLTPGAHRLTLMAQGHNFSPYYMMPNAYVVAGKLKPRVIAASRTAMDAATGQETLPFVTPFSDEAQLATQVPTDKLTWLTPERLFAQNAQRASDVAKPEFMILPMPAAATHMPGKRLDLTRGVKITVTGAAQNDVQAAINTLKAAGFAQTKDGIPIVVSVGKAPGGPESYHMVASEDGITIVSPDSAGASYGLQSLTQQAIADKGHLKPLEITDAPRFAFRGLHLDLARNFLSKREILTVIEQMSVYKLNRLHLHLGDDEGWRLAIADLPELTEIGAKRCHDLAEDKCLLPQLGAGPVANASVNGFLTRADYIAILKAAKARHIDVIPSFDMPGHSRAAVRSMEARARRLIAAGKPVEAAQYRLVDPNDTTVYSSIQHYNDNTLDICLPSTYAFIDKVMETIKAMHAEAGLPLRRYHIGTDETAGAWTGSPACQALMKAENLTVAQLGARFITRVSDLLGDKGIEPGGWSDGMGSVDPAQMPKVVQSNSWGSLFGGGAAEAYRQANQGWDVVLSTPDVLYLDMPNAADGHERGYDWASRQTDLYKVFAFMPENLGANAVVMTDTRAMAHTITDPTPLNAGRHIAGMQGQLWSETVRSDAIANYMLFPRTLAVAERAWHKADWEPDYVAGKSYIYGDGSVDQTKLLDDWQGFQSRVTQAMTALDQTGIAYRLPLPGARITNGILEANVGVEGLRIVYKTGQGRWTTYKGPVEVAGPASLRTVSPDGKRYSRTVVVQPQALNHRGS